MIHYTFKRETRVERKIFILSRSIHFYSDIGGSRTIVLRQVGAARAGEKETQRRRAPVAYWCDSPNPARAPTVEHVCNTTRRAPASGEERNTRDSIPLARSTRHSPLNSRRSAAVVSLSLSLSPRRAPFSVWNRGAVEAECRTRTRIHRPPISKRSATLRPGMPFPFGNPLEPVAHSRPRAPIHAIGPPLTGGD